MLKWIALVLAASLGLNSQLPAPTAAEEPPPQTITSRPHSGIGGIVVGYAGLGVGAAALAIIPACYANFYPAGGSTACAIGQGVVGSLAIATGIVGLSIGYKRRARYKEWRAQHRANLDGVNLGATIGGAMLHYRVAF